MLRFFICGSVSDGQSTLIRQLSHDRIRSVDDEPFQIDALGEHNVFAPSAGGKDADREQESTVDLQYRFFSTEHRGFLVAHTPSHERNVRDLVASASTADLAVVLVDARNGLLARTRHHALLLALLGIRDLVLVVNKMDLVGYDQTVYEKIDTDFRAFADDLPGGTSVVSIPISALNDDNVVERSKVMDWYRGPSFMSVLETTKTASSNKGAGFAMPVNLVSHSPPDFPVFAGKLAAGDVTVGDKVRALPLARETTIAGIAGADGDLRTATKGQSVTLRLTDEIDISRGDVIASSENPPEVADQFEATVVWMSDAPMLSGRTYAFRLATCEARMTVSSLKYRVSADTMKEMAASKLELGEIGRCTISLDKRIPFTPYDQNKTLGGFVIIDRITKKTVGIGMIHFALRRASNVHLQSFDVDRDARAGIKGHSAAILWFTGLSGSGKSTIANILERKLVAGGHHTILLDGDNVRHGLNRDLGFTDADRVENIRRIGEVARLMTDAGLIVLVSFISPFASERRMARNLAVEGEFVEIHVSTPLEVAEVRDVKGLYKKARAGEIKNFTGIDSPYEEPENAEIVVDTSKVSAEEAANTVMNHLENAGIFKV